ncbi:hypothetical protein GCM10009085_53810 [Pseudomonas avellanae]|nr:hypothetical protein GCM10009085_53810 [Pseudomonas avellanae]
MSDNPYADWPLRIRLAITSCVTKLVSSYAAVTDQSHSPDASAGA